MCYFLPNIVLFCVHHPHIHCNMHTIITGNKLLAQKHGFPVHSLVPDRKENMVQNLDWPTINPFSQSASWGEVGPIGLRLVWCGSIIIIFIIRGGGVQRALGLTKHWPSMLEGCWCFSLSWPCTGRWTECTSTHLINDVMESLWKEAWIRAA